MMRSITLESRTLRVKAEQNVVDHVGSSAGPINEDGLEEEHYAHDKQSGVHNRADDGGAYNSAGVALGGERPVNAGSSPAGGNALDHAQRAAEQRVGVPENRSAGIAVGDAHYHDDEAEHSAQPRAGLTSIERAADDDGNQRQSDRERADLDEGRHDLQNNNQGSEDRKSRHAPGFPGVSTCHIKLPPAAVPVLARI